MTVIPLRRRLADLEARDTPPAAIPKLHPLSTLLDVLLAFHLGAMQPHESLSTGMCRALGYPTNSALSVALLAETDTLGEDDFTLRRGQALDRLFALRGTTTDCDGPTFVAVSCHARAAATAPVLR